MSSKRWVISGLGMLYTKPPRGSVEIPSGASQSGFEMLGDFESRVIGFMV